MLLSPLVKLIYAPLRGQFLGEQVAPTNHWLCSFCFLVQQQVTTGAPARRHYQKSRVGPVVSVGFPFLPAAERAGGTGQLPQQALSHPHPVVFVLQSKHAPLLVDPKDASLVQNLRQDHHGVAVCGDGEITTRSLVPYPRVVGKLGPLLAPRLVFYVSLRLSVHQVCFEPYGVVLVIERIEYLGLLLERDVEIACQRTQFLQVLGHCVQVLLLLKHDGIGRRCDFRRIDTPSAFLKEFRLHSGYRGVVRCRYFLVRMHLLQDQLALSQSRHVLLQL
mmetsp:Transcript_25480/g.54353  ORF Transcript_25480/g.54353 Transcript_25480/m.54353 type:complete len:276 (-) Transcript_25480:547-1374(-)